VNCNICNKKRKIFNNIKRKILYGYCESCEFIFKSPELYLSLSEQKKRYSFHNNNDKDEEYKKYFRNALSFTLNQISKPKKALDFGCGRTTLLAQLLEEEGVPCDYYDPIYYPKTLINRKLYDFIISVEVFEHLPNPREIFENLVNFLEVGGYLAIQTEFHANDIESFKTWWYPNDPTHIVFFRPKTFEVLCKLYDCSLIADNGKNIILIQKN